jgi:hypothetical protein
MSGSGLSGFLPERAADDCNATGMEPQFASIGHSDTGINSPPGACGCTRYAAGDPPRTAGACQSGRNRSRSGRLRAEQGPLPAGIAGAVHFGENLSPSMAEVGVPAN